MDFERHLMKHNGTCCQPEEIAPKGAIIYSSGFPAFRSAMERVYDRENYRASVHALIDDTGITQLLPLNARAKHSGTQTGNSGYLGIMVCEPNPTSSKVKALRDSTSNNLVQYLTFLCRYWDINPMNVCNVIQFAGTAKGNNLVVPEVAKMNRSQITPYYGKACDCDVDPELYCDENSIITRVKETLEWINTKYGEVPHPAETPLTQIGIGDVVLFTGGDLFKSRGISSRETFDRDMHFGIVTDKSPSSRHVYEVAFPSGSTYWVNKSTLVRSTLGHVSL